MSPTPEPRDEHARIRHAIALAIGNIQAAMNELEEVMLTATAKATPRHRAKSSILQIRRAYLEVVLRSFEAGIDDLMTRQYLFGETTFSLNRVARWHIVTERHLDDPGEQVYIVQRLATLVNTQRTDIQNLSHDRGRLARVVAKVRRVCRTFLQMASPDILTELDDLCDVVSPIYVFDPNGDLDDDTTDAHA